MISSGDRKFDDFFREDVITSGSAQCFSGGG